jgi:hypothetical protein
LGIVFLASASRAQETNVKADVPFDFVAGDHVYPAGEYTLKSMLDTDAVIRIDGSPEFPGRNLLSNACTLITPSKQTKLVFRRVGESYFLYQVWVAGNLGGREFPRGRAETRLAQNRQDSDLVVVAVAITK